MEERRWYFCLSSKKLKIRHIELQDEDILLYYFFNTTPKLALQILWVKIFFSRKLRRNGAYKAKQAQQNNGNKLHTKPKKIYFTDKIKWRGNSKNLRGIIKGRVGIEECTKIAEQKIRFGDLEGNILIGANHKRAILMLNDSATGLCWLSKSNG